eukprot:591689-Rhodomonas_salina.1
MAGRGRGQQGRSGQGAGQGAGHGVHGEPGGGADDLRHPHTPVTPTGFCPPLTTRPCTSLMHFWGPGA